MFALGEKTVNQRKHKLVCKHVALYMDKAVTVLYHTTNCYNRRSDLGGH